MMIELPVYDLDYSKKVTGKELREAHEKAAEKYGYSHLKSKIPGREHEVLSIVEYKFMLYNWCLENDIFKEPVRDKFQTSAEYIHARERWSKAWLLFKDYSIYAYANLKLNGKPLMLYPFQDVIINDRHKRVDVESSNQLGKSITLCVKATINYLLDHGKNYTIGLISKSMAQNSMNMRMIKLLLRTANVEYTPGEHDNMAVTTRDIMREKRSGSDNIVSDEVVYTNTLVCGVAGTSSLGFPFDDLLLDEFEFWDMPQGLDYMYDQVMEPRTFHTKGSIMLFSNPNGKNFVSENLQKRKKNDGSLVFHVYNFNFLDKPGNTLEEWDERKNTTHPIIFASTVAAERTESEGSFFTDSEIRDSFDKNLNEARDYAGMDKQCYFFLDIGSVHDQSVLVGMFIDKDEHQNDIFKMFYTQFYPVTFPLWRVVGIDPNARYGEDGEITGKTALNVNDGWEETALKFPSVKSVMDRYTFPPKYDATGKKVRDYIQPVLGVDVTGHAAIIPLCHAAGISPIDVTFSGPAKWKMYERFKTLMAKRFVKRIKQDNWLDGRNQEFEYQARKIRIRTGTRFNLVHHEHEDDLDDVIDSCVGCISMADYGMKQTIGVDYVEKSLNIEHDDEMDKEVWKSRYGSTTFNY